MIWRSEGYSDAALALADEHYNRQKPGTGQFAPPGRRLVLVAGDPVAAVWCSSHQRFPDHAWPGAWVCTMFRNVGAGLSSELIRDAIAVTREEWGDPPDQGMITFVDPRKVRNKRDPGRCFRRAGFVPIACTLRRRLLTLRLEAADFPEAAPAFSRQIGLWSA